MEIQEIISNSFNQKNQRELYHSLYNHPEFVSLVSNSDIKEKVELIIDLIRQYMNTTNKEQVKILDVGSAEGYIDFCIKEILGNKVKITGVESFEPSVQISQLINKEMDWDLEFKLREQNITNLDFIKTISDGEYDIVFLFNVLHWTSLQDGSWQNSRIWLEHLSNKVDIILLELAGFDKSNETRAPKNYLEWFNNIAFFSKLKETQHFTGSGKRPFYLASNKLFYVQDNFKFIESYQITFDGMRRAYRNNDTILKIVYKTYSQNKYNISFEDCILELKQEMKNAQKGLSFSPDIEYFIDSKDICLSVLKLKKIGQSLVSIDSNRPKERDRKFLDILNNLIEAEEQSLYHYDLTLWNIMQDKNGQAFLIDIGAFIGDNIIDGGNSILKKINPQTNCNSFDAFMGIVWDLLISRTNTDFLLSKVGFHPISIFFDEEVKIPKNYRNFFKAFQASDRKCLSFNYIKQLFIKYVLNKEELLWNQNKEEIYCYHYEKRRSENNNLELYTLIKLLK